MIQLTDIQLIRGGNILLDQANLTIFPNHKVGLVGENGCGKSSLFSMLMGKVQPDEGDLSIPKDWEIASVAQETPALDRTAIEYVIDGDVEYRTIEQQLVEAEEAHQGELIATLHQKLDAIHGYSINARAGELLSGLGFSAEQLNSPVKSFSGGWRMRLNLAQALLCRSDLLLLDEPTNHLDLDTVIWLESWLKSYQGTLILISHDREFLDNVVKQIVHIERKQPNAYTGNYSSFEKQRIEKMVLQQAMYEKQQKQRAHLQSFIDRFKAKASKAKQAQSRVKALEKMEEIAPAHADSPFNFSFYEPAQLPNPLLTMEDVVAGYGEKIILKKVLLNLVPGSRIGLLGRNGAGKSTLIKLIAGDITSIDGKVAVNPGAKIGYFAQHQLETLHDDETPLEHIQRLMPSETEQALRTYLGSFGFQGDKALQKVAPFSGGEKARLVLALIVSQKPNLLLLDEPTNHLDLEMRHALTMALQAFSGAMVVVSHDRSLLKMTTDDFYLVDNGQVDRFEGDLDDYHQWLVNANKADKADSNSSDKPASESTAINRKEQKRLEAEFRNKARPVKKQVEKWEKEMTRLSEQKDDIEQQLSDATIYDAVNKDKLTMLLQQQTTLTKALNEAEENWFEATEEYESLVEEFNQG